MGQGISCNGKDGDMFFQAIRDADLSYVREIIDNNPTLINSIRCFNESSSPLHLAASLGHIQILKLLLEKGAKIDALNTHCQTPIIMACRNGHSSCVAELIQNHANILLFDKISSRTCLHYAAKGGYAESTRLVLEAAKGGPVAQTWGYLRFINVRDSRGTTPLHLAARSGSLATVRLLLDSGALVSSSTSLSGVGPGKGSLPLHFAARGGSLEVVRELIAWGADRNQRDSNGFTPHYIALKSGHHACAVLLDPQSPEPLVWPSPWKFMSLLDPKARDLLEKALTEANDQLIANHSIQNKDVSAFNSNPPRCQVMPCSFKINCVMSKFDDLPEPSLLSTMENGSDYDDDKDDDDLVSQCDICFERVCDIEVVSCGHRMCATCTLALCSHCKPNQSSPSYVSPCCPFCRRHIDRLIAVESTEVTSRPPHTH